MNLALQEQETIILFNEAEKTASVYTHNRAFLRKLEKLAQDRPEDCKLKRSDTESRVAEYIVPKRWIKINAPRQISEEEKARLRKVSESTRFSQNSGDLHRVQENNLIE